LGDAGSGDPTDFTRQSPFQGFLGMFPGISLIFFLFGLNVLGNDLRENGNNEPLFRLGGMGVFFGIVGIILGTSLGAGVNFENITVTDGYESILHLVAGSISTYTGLLFSIGITLIALSISSNRDGAQRLFAYLVALLGIVNIVVGFLNLLDTTTWESTFILTPLSYVVFSIWTVTLGMNLIKKS
jgi:uncharacterized membrane protein